MATGDDAGFSLDISFLDSTDANHVLGNNNALVDSFGLSLGKSVSTGSHKIGIKCEPRPEFRPRTMTEHQHAFHYLRCVQDDEHEHPTIDIPGAWKDQSDMNIIEVALVDVAKRLHPYFLTTKDCVHSFSEDTLIFQEDDRENVIYFRVMEEDFEAGFKSFKIAFIKRSQSDATKNEPGVSITKALIAERNLTQSMLRFTRIYHDASDQLQADDEGVAYSCVMTEKYRKVSLSKMPRSQGPMNGGTVINVPMLGIEIDARDKVSIIVWEKNTPRPTPRQDVQWNEQTAFFFMPPCLWPQGDPVDVNIRIYFNEKELGGSTHQYSQAQEISVRNNMQRQTGNVGPHRRTNVYSATEINTN